MHRRGFRDGWQLPAVFFCLLLGGCAGGSSTSALPARQSAQSVPLTVSIKWPTPASQNIARRPAFISPSALSVTLYLNGVLVATMNAPATGGTTTSTTLAFQTGQTLTMKTWDGTNGTGTLLGEGSTQPDIVLGQANVVDVAIGGIATSATLTPEPNQPLLEGDSTSGYTLVGPQPEIFDLALKDADGNLIVTDPPPFTLSGNSGIFSQYNDSASQITFYGFGNTSGYETITVHFNNPDGSVVDTAPVKIQDTPIVAVINHGTNSIAEYDGNGNPVVLPPGSFAGLRNPTAMIYDTCLRTIIVADSTLNTLLFYGTNGESYPFTVGPFPGISAPTAMIENYADQAYMVANAGDDSIRYYNPEGEEFTPVIWNHVPIAIACIIACDQLIAISSDDSATSFGQVPLGPGAFPGLNSPTAMFEIPGVNNTYTLYVTNGGNNTVTTYDGNGNPITTAGNFPGLSHPSGITEDPETNGLLVANEAANSLTAYDLQGNPVTLAPGAFPNLNAPSAVLGIVNVQCLQ